MKKLIVLLLFLNFPLNASEIEAGKWNFVVDQDYCYIASFPTKKDIPTGKSRGDTFILVYRMNKSPDAIVQIDAGYPYDEEKSVEVKIDKKAYSFYSQSDSAWTKTDSKVIDAMKKGVELTIKGTSSRGTTTIDKYTLKGFTAAYNQLMNDC